MHSLQWYVVASRQRKVLQLEWASFDELVLHLHEEVNKLNLPLAFGLFIIVHLSLVGSFLASLLVSAT